MATQLGVAIVGLGEAGATLHLPALSGIPSARVVGACDAQSGQRDAVAARWRVPVFADFASLLRETRPDVVCIATPPESHAALCLEAIAAGADVICEKPFVASVEDADRVIAAAAAAGRLVAVNHEFREMPIFRALVDAARGRREGDIVFAQAWQQIHLPPSGESGWRGALARRTLFEAGVHHLDLLMALFAETPTAVRAAISSGLDAADHDAIVVAVLEFSRGRLALLTQNRLTRGEPQYFEARVDFANASYRASFGGRARVSAGLFRSTRPHVRVEFGQSGIAWRESGSRRRIVARNPVNPNVDATRRVLAAALDAFKSRTPPASPASQAREVMAAVDACYEAAATGSRVVVARL